MKAAVLQGVQQDLVVKTTPDPESANSEEVIVRLFASAINHRDLWIQKGKYANIELPVILGSDGAGKWQASDVIIQPGLSWGNKQEFASPEYQILGMPRNGTFSEYVKVPRANIYPKPDHLSWYEAGALPLAGLTAYRAAMVQAKVTQSDKVLITGIGGGVALQACQFCLAIGAKVFVTSGSDDKIQKAIDLGAKGGVNYRNELWINELKQMTGGIDKVIDGAGGSGLSQTTRICNSGASLVCYGGTTGTIPLNPQRLFWKQLTLKGSTMGSPTDFMYMLDFVNKHQIKPIVDSIFTLNEINHAFNYVSQGKQFGKVVINIMKQ